MEDDFIVVSIVRRDLVTLDKADQPPWLAGLDRSVPLKNGVGDFLEVVTSLN